MLTRTRRPKTESQPAAAGSTDLPPFHNEPPTDFARAENREAMRQRARRGSPPARPPLSALDRRQGGRYGGLALLDSREPQPELADRRAGGAGRCRARRGRGRRGQIGVPGLGGDPGRRPRRRLDQGGGDHAAAPLRAGRLGGLTSAASPGPRPTPTSPRRSISASSTPAR